MRWTEEVLLKKVMALCSVVLAFLCQNEILTLFLIGVGCAVVAIIILAAWAKTEKKSLPGSFNKDWGEK